MFFDVSVVPSMLCGAFLAGHTILLPGFIYVTCSYLPRMYQYSYKNNYGICHVES